MRYLVATDGSDESDAAVRYAADHAETFGATLEIVSVVSPETEIVDGEIVMEGHETAAEAGQRTLESAADLAGTAADVTIETRLLSGRPAEAVTQRAEEADVDAIFVGHRGLSADKESVVGSVAKSIVGKANTPVTVVR